MSHKQILEASSADIQREIEASCEESHFGNGNLQIAL